MPLSMLWLAIITHPMMAQARAEGAQPRTLADDATVTASGPNHWPTLIAAASRVIRYLQLAGSKISRAKSVLFSTCQSVRARMRRYTWPVLGTKIQVRLHARDLGAHVSFGRRMFAHTAVARYSDAMHIMNRIATLPVPPLRRLHLLCTKALARALYAVESTPLQSAGIRSMTTAIKRCIRTGSGPVTNPRMLCLTYGPKCPDPVFIALIRRARKLRQMFHQHQYHGMISSIMYHHVCARTPGTPPGDEMPEQCAKGVVAAGVLFPAHSATEFCALGPVALFLSSIYKLGAVMDGDFCIHAPGFPVFSLVTEAWQGIHEVLLTLHQRSVVRAVAETRQSLAPAVPIDWRGTLRYHKAWPHARANMLRAIHAGGIWTPTRCTRPRC